MSDCTMWPTACMSAQQGWGKSTGSWRSCDPTVLRHHLFGASEQADVHGSGACSSLATPRLTVGGVQLPLQQLWWGMVGSGSHLAAAGEVEDDLHVRCIR